jgi:hypothetical protein
VNAVRTHRNLAWWATTTKTAVGAGRRLQPARSRKALRGSKVIKLEQNYRSTNDPERPMRSSNTDAGAETAPVIEAAMARSRCTRSEVDEDEAQPSWRK